LLRAFESRMAQTFDATVFISAAEAALFKSICPAAAPKVTFRTQGVDVHYFDPTRSHDNPFPSGDRPLVFVGAMDYWPNIQAVSWYTKEVFPRVLERCSRAKFFIVGTSPTPEVKRLASLPGVVVTGAVPDVRPYLQHAWAACVPLQIAQGIQNKALEAMAMGKVVLASPQALTGISASPSYAPISCTTPEEWVSLSIAALEAERVHDEAAREFVKEHYGWETNMQRFEKTVFG
jgi:polysaccharide biosynthesis protein PslH